MAENNNINNIKNETLTSTEENTVAPLLEETIEQQVVKNNNIDITNTINNDDINNVKNTNTNKEDSVIKEIIDTIDDILHFQINVENSLREHMNIVNATKKENQELTGVALNEINKHIKESLLLKIMEFKINEIILKKYNVNDLNIFNNYIDITKK